VTSQERQPLRRDLFFLVLGGAWGTWTVITAGPWPLMLISAATMLGPGFLRLWLSAPGTRGNPGLPPPEPPGPLPSSSAGSSPALEGET
jgi:hypothetical protein